MREKFTQASEFKINKFNLKIIETPKGKPMTVELSNQGGEEELAQIQMYKPGKKGATILLTRSKGEIFEVVQIIADNFIEVVLKAFLKGSIKGDEEMKDYEKQGIILDNNIFDCDKCDRKFSTHHGLPIHTAWHTKRAKTEIPTLPVKHTVEPNGSGKRDCVTHSLELTRQQKVAVLSRTNFGQFKVGHRCKASSTRDVASVENAPNSGAFSGAHEKQA